MVNAVNLSLDVRPRALNRVDVEIEGANVFAGRVVHGLVVVVLSETAVARYSSVSTIEPSATCALTASFTPLSE